MATFHYEVSRHRKAVTFRLQPAIIDRIRTISADTGCSMADLIEDMVMECYP